MKNTTLVAPLLVALALTSTLAAAQPMTATARSAPVAVPIDQTVPDAVDVPYPGGTIGLDINASDTQRGVFRVTQTIPLAPGTTRLTLFHPLWLPGKHSAAGSTAELLDLRFMAGGKALEWKRDPLEVNAFHIAVPAGAREVIAKFIRTTPLQASEGRIVMTQEMLNLQW